ncbi:aldo/keto reductase [Roseovarius aestuarii]|nr:aldo/keto reductase [Roseovarius aestuarii]
MMIRCFCAVAVLGASAPVRAAGLDPGTTRVIPKTGEHIPVIGLGSWITFNVGEDPKLLTECAQVIAAFAEEGGGMIDSSPMYGSSQSTIGHGLAQLGDRSDIFTAEKVWTSSPGDGPGQIAETRREWGVPGFDLLQVHNLRAWEGNLDTLFEMKEEGKLRHVGITTSHGRRHDLLERIMREQPIDFVQLTYNVLDRAPEDRLLPLAQERGVAVIVNRPYQRGALIERYRGAQLPGWAVEIGAETWPQVLLKFIISHPAVTVAIPATRQIAHLRENKAASRGLLPDAKLRRRMAWDLAQI